MCGIVGIFQKKLVDKKVLNRMTKALSHRGPDDEGVFVDKNIGLGHRRLSILDLSKTGHQPMFTKDKSLVIVYNGEIYNFLEIKKKLEKKGYQFRSTSDTEVILYAYQEWGEDCVKQFNGMWAFIIYNFKKRQFFVSRDRLGIKPLYWYKDDQKIIFASEIKAILQYPGVKPKLDLDALNEYFTFQNILSAKTLFKGIYLLQPAENILISENEFKIYKYWDADFTKKEKTSSLWRKELLSNLKDSVWRHMIADVPVGTFLSGGMDSTTIAHFASQKNPRFVTFSGGFDLEGAQGDEALLDERKEAEIVARRVSSEHYETVVSPASVKLAMPQIIWHLEDLRLGMCYPQFFISKLASKFVKVSLSGTGGDELFGGYPWRYKLIANAKDEKDFDRKQYDYWSRLIKDNQKQNFFSKEVLENIDLQKPFESYKQIINPANNLQPVDKAIYFEQKTFLHGFFIVEDKMSMAHSIEVRVPMTDMELVKLVNPMPVNLKYKGQDGKVFFRDTMKKLLPEEIVKKRKTGFTPPEASWYRGQLKDYLEEMILGKRALSRGIFKKEFLKEIFHEHMVGKRDHRLLFWSLISFEWWCRIFLEGEGKMYEPKT